MGELPHLPVTSHIGATLNFETLERLVGELQEQGKRVSGGGVGAWTNPESLSAKLTESTIQARTEAGSTTARLKGSAKTTAEIKVGETIFTLKSTHRPPQQVNAPFAMLTSTPANLLLLEPSGVATARIAIPTATFVLFDGITFNLT